MAYAVWIVLLASVFSCAEEVQWTELCIEELGTKDDANRVVVTRGTISNEFAIRLKCPKPFVIYPRNDNEAAAADPHVFVEAGGSFLEVPLSTVVISLHGKPIVRLFQDEENNVMEIQYSGVYYSNEQVVAIIRKNARRIFFLCASPPLTLKHDLMTKLPYVTSVRDTPIKLSVMKDIVLHLEGNNTALGVFSVHLREIQKATHGCGSIDTPQLINEVHHDKETGVRSCTVDIMEHPNVAFYCDGTIQPYNCFNQFYHSQENELMYFNGFVSTKQSYDTNWLFANYNRKRLQDSFSGYCKCVDKSTGKVKAKITVTAAVKSYVCDISALMFKHLTKPIIGNWCDVGLFVGSTLTIKVPINVYGEEITKNNGGTMRQKPMVMTSYINPQDMRTHFLNYEDLDNEIYLPYVYERGDYISGDAIQIDQSRQNEGIITMRYIKDRPLSYPPWLTGFTYIWYLSTNRDIIAIKDIVAAINVIPVITHDYYLIGCESPISSVFSEEDYRTNKGTLDIYKHRVRVCHFTPRFMWKFGLYCPPGQRIGPANYTKYAYNSSLQDIEVWPDNVKVYRNNYVSNMITIRGWLTADQVENSVSCSCIDSAGRETARAIISYQEQQRAYFETLGKGENRLLLPSVKIVNINTGYDILTEIQEIPLPFPHRIESKMLMPGNDIIIYVSRKHCLQRQDHHYGYDTIEDLFAFEDDISNDELYNYEGINHRDSDDLSLYEALFLPLNIKKYFYQHVITGNKAKLIPLEYSKVLGTNYAGFKVETSEFDDREHDIDSVTLSNPMSSIIVSKTNEKEIQLTYACGKLTRPRNWMGDESARQYDVKVGADAETRKLGAQQSNQTISLATPDSSGSFAPIIEIDNSSTTTDVKETRYLNVFGVMNIAIPVTDPYLRGCGMTDPSEELFRDDTVPLLNDAGERIGCEVDLALGDASFYCPLPYHTEPPNCMPKSSAGTVIVNRPGEIGNEHFYIFQKTKWSIWKIFKIWKTIMVLVSQRGTFDCHCVTDKGIIMSTIRIHA
ncbi:hypothetical protein BgAZ_100580 [Babesia gibsoni]|uniref:6-Cys domain-containing protein n=1 Tax=Babesia gibsoni TaxID=33632 RepID=A0AAD8PF54_BABGI|nr:hypothetical protein BgAZ_100580 [Babesia gibsoni]